MFDESRVQRWSNPKTGHSPEFWSRAMGWYILGLIDVLETFPETNPKKKELIHVFEQLTDALIKVQDPASGVWWQVTDKPFAKDNYLESSGSSMFVAAMFKEDNFAELEGGEGKFGEKAQIKSDRLFETLEKSYQTKKSRR